MNTINGQEALNQRWYNVEHMYTYDELVIHLKQKILILFNHRRISAFTAQ